MTLSATSRIARSASERSDDDSTPRASDGRPLPSGKDGEFQFSTQEEPHKARRTALAKDHPEVRKFQNQKDPKLAYSVAFALAVQLIVASLVSELPWWAVTVLAYCISGTINHSMTLAMHEISHNLAFKGLFWNRVLGMAANAPLGLPAFVSFKRYHMEHHKYQGEEGVDTDIPTRVEGWFFKGTARKVLWVLLQPAFYALRPLMVVKKEPGAKELVNWTVQVAFDAAVYYFFGPKALFYLIGGTLLGMGLHPMAGHFIAEHYTFLTKQETYSYYGPLNWFSFHVGYHNEHHDLPNVPGKLLPAVRATDAAYYDDLPAHSSWALVIYRYIVSPLLGPYSRVKRGHGISTE